tara:strand:+ start:494 stop:1027 length:534 start_codon:yes stop_codon:yes gene_type:complete
MEHLFVIDNFLTEPEADEIYEEVLRWEPELMKLGPHDYPGVKGDGLTGRYKYYNGLNNELIGKILIPKFLTLFGMGRFYQCWFNAFRKGDRIEPHIHNTHKVRKIKQFQCTNLFIGGDASEGTYYGNELIPNKKGSLFIFHDSLPHWTEPYKGDDVRITMACDLHTTRQNPMMKQLK